MAVRIGDVGRAISALAPSGSAEINGVLEKVRADGAAIEAGSAIVVLGGDATGYLVGRVEPGQPPARLPNHGAPIRRSQSADPQADIAEAWRQEQQKQRRKLLADVKHTLLAAAALGGMFGLASGALGWWWKSSGEADRWNPWVLLSVTLVAGAAWGAALMVLTGWTRALLAYWHGKAQLLEFDVRDLLGLVAGLAGATVAFLIAFGSRGVIETLAWTAGASLVAWAFGVTMTKAIDSQ